MINHFSLSSSKPAAHASAYSVHLDEVHRCAKAIIFSEVIFCMYLETGDNNDNDDNDDNNDNDDNDDNNDNDDNDNNNDDDEDDNRLEKIF
jgi:hypothetical protein